mgnify:CR=1 FL=1
MENQWACHRLDIQIAFLVVKDVLDPQLFLIEKPLGFSVSNRLLPKSTHLASSQRLKSHKNITSKKLKRLSNVE